MMRVIHKPWVAYAKPYDSQRIAAIVANRLIDHCKSVKVKRIDGKYQLFTRGKK